MNKKQFREQVSLVRQAIIKAIPTGVSFAAIIVALAEEAIKVINHPVANSLLIQMPGKWGKSNHRYLAGPNSPKGEIVQSYVGYIVVCFDAADVLAWCVANSGGLITIKQ